MRLSIQRYRPSEQTVRRLYNQKLCPSKGDSRPKTHPQQTHGAQRRLRLPRNTGCWCHPGLENVNCGMWGEQTRQPGKRSAKQSKERPMEYRLQEPCKRKTRPQAENKQPQMNMDTIQETGLGNTVGDDIVELNPSVKKTQRPA